MNDLEIRQYEESIIEAINSKPLPLEIKRLILRDIMTSVENELGKEIMQQQQQQETKEDQKWHIQKYLIELTGKMNQV